MLPFCYSFRLNFSFPYDLNQQKAPYIWISSCNISSRIHEPLASPWNTPLERKNIEAYSLTILCFILFDIFNNYLVNNIIFIMAMRGKCLREWSTWITEIKRNFDKTCILGLLTSLYISHIVGTYFLIKVIDYAFKCF